MAQPIDPVDVAPSTTASATKYSATCHYANPLALSAQGLASLSLKRNKLSAK